MSLERVKAQILEDARKEAEALIRTAREGLQNKLERARLSLREDLEERLTLLSRELQEEKRRALSNLQASYDLELLSLKNHIIDRLLGQALDRILSLPRGEYLTLLESWLRNTNIREKAELRLSSRDMKDIGPELVKKINESVQADLLHLSTSPIDIRGGFVLVTKDFEVDRSLDTLLRHLREELAPVVAEKLFGE